MCISPSPIISIEGEEIAPGMQRGFAPLRYLIIPKTGARGLMAFGPSSLARTRKGTQNDQERHLRIL